MVANVAAASRTNLTTVHPVNSALPAIVTSSTFAAAPLSVVPSPTEASFQVGITGRNPPLPGVASIPQPLRGFYGERRILVVDDYEWTLMDMQSGLQEFFRTVDAIADPTHVVDRLQEAKADGHPYDALVLDLRMPGLNGDDLLRAIAQKGLLLPTVIHSGSHAREVQAHLLPQIERVRTEEMTRRLAEREELEAAFVAISSPEELRAWKTKYHHITDGVPLAFVAKHLAITDAGPLPYAHLAHSIARVIATGEETNWSNFQAAVAQFKPKLWDGGSHTQYIEALSEAARFIAGRLRQMKERMERAGLGPVIAEDKLAKKLWVTCCSDIEVFSGPECSVMGLSGELDGEKTAAFRRHGLPSWITTSRNNLRVMLKRCPKFREAVDQHPGLREEIERFGELCQKVSIATYIPRSLADESQTIGVADSIRFVLPRISGEIVTHFPERRLRIRTPGNLFHGLVEQPLLNAVQWMEGREGKVEVFLDARRIADIDATSQAYFRDQHSLGDDDEIVAVSIVDQGPGIPPENLQRIFEPQFTTRRHGTGFGLSYVAKYIGELNGTVHVESELGRGTTFSMYFLPAPDTTS